MVGAEAWRPRGLRGLGARRGDPPDGQRQRAHEPASRRAQTRRRTARGLLRCRRCGRKLTSRYTGTRHDIPRYACHRGQLDNGEPRCIAFGGLRVDDAIVAALLQVVEPGAITAALAAETENVSRQDQVRAALSRDLEAARYAAERAWRQYDAADPVNRLVTGELEMRWNAALARVADVDAKIAYH